MCSGLELVLPKGGYKNSKEIPENSASLDRIDSDDYYHKNNIQWIHKDIQCMKWNKSEEEFIKWCKIITNNIKEKNH